MGTDAAVQPLMALAGRRRFLGGRKLRALKETSVDALLKIGTPTAETTLREAGQTGDRALKKIIAARLRN